MLGSVERWLLRSGVFCCLCGCVLSDLNRSVDVRNLCFSCEKSLSS
jgi:hypothetical protein